MNTCTPPIVVAVDGSIASVHALRWAMIQAELTSAPVRAVLTWETPEQTGLGLSVPVGDWADLAQRALESALEEAGGAARRDIETMVMEGHPASVLVDASAGAQLLVVGSGSHGAFAGLLLGAVSEQVIAHVTAYASCPVLVIHAASAAPPQELVDQTAAA